ncbi:hypothetical protein FSP39_005728 [Pinctada imbricata]|uniref:Uncharacterized protein n=1 Tax=Pinctada imbricata TaxID=66713 RepID=A0AA88YML8_PINIB|nr:hypothetical protein FSP39_005728 [Pinctada imbricata]
MHDVPCLGNFVPTQGVLNNLQTSVSSASSPDTGKDAVLSIVQTPQSCSAFSAGNSQGQNDGIDDKYFDCLPASDFERFLIQVENNSITVKNRVKRSLHNHVKFWEQIDTYDSV